MDKSNILQELIPFKATHPGAIISDELDYIGITPCEFAELLGMPAAVFCSLLNGNIPLSIEVAQRIEQHTDLKADQLIALQLKYQAESKRIRTGNGLS